jgi:thiol-disulfide isomerase/thioredoxin
VLAALAGGLAGLAAIYVKGPGNGNANAECGLAVVEAKRLDPLIHGEIAAFLPASRPLSLADLSFRGPNGSPMSVGDFGGRTVLLNLWATWCVPCREEMPALDRLQQAVGGADFEVVAVNIDTRESARPREFLTEIEAVTLRFYHDPTTGIFNQLKADGIARGMPTTVLVDERGCALGWMSGPAVWDSEEAFALIDAARS